MVSVCEKEQETFYCGGFDNCDAETHETEDCESSIPIKEFIAFCRTNMYTIVITYTQDSGFCDDYLSSESSELIKPLINSYCELLSKFKEGNENGS